MRLKVWLTAEDISYKNFAEAAELGETVVSRAVNGKVMPSPNTIEKIKKTTGGAVTADDFHEQVTEGLGGR